MAEAKVVTYTTIEEARTACQAENDACKVKGEGKERFVFDITVQGEHKFYVVATLSGKARAIAALALDIKASVAEKKNGGTRKSALETLSSDLKTGTIDMEEIAKIKALLAQMEQASAKGVTEPVAPVAPVAPVVDTETFDLGKTGEEVAAEIAAQPKVKKRK